MEEADGDLRVALVMHRAKADVETALDALKKSSFVVEAAVSELSN